MCVPYFSSCSGGPIPSLPALAVGSNACRAMSGGAPSPGRASKVEPKCPPWMNESGERLEKRRKDALAEKWKRQRHQWDEDAGEDEVAEESLPPPGDSSRGHGAGRHDPGSFPEGVSRPDDMKAFRHAALTPASFASARHLFMCCGRPIVVRLLMTVSPAPAFLIRTRFESSGIGYICPI